MSVHIEKINKIVDEIEENLMKYFLFIAMSIEAFAQDSISNFEYRLAF